MSRLLIMYKDYQVLGISEELQDVQMAVNVCFECEDGVLGEVPEESYKKLTPYQQAEFLVKVAKESIC